ncbi:MAG TPA: hypothetical protein VMX38_22185 [Verrucomicrobiae bacterium]|jgi:hypothetical protein|nr:hypothetical protein [Verrucomicrobiae bacterium]
MRYRWLLFVCLFAIAVPLALGQLGTVNSKYGSAAPQWAVVGPVVEPSSTEIYPNADYSTGGVALRNVGQRSVIVSGSPTTGSIDAIAYWSVLGPIKNADYYITVRRLWPNPTTAPYMVTVFGTLIAIGGDPCWGSTGNYIFKAHLPTTVVTGNGNYLISFAPAASGLTTGDDPWVHNAFPAMEGAALVVLKTGTHVVSVFDSQAGITFAGPLSYTLSLLVPTTGQVLWDNIGADGQLGTSLTPTVTGKTTTVNGTLVAGPGAPDMDSDWDGSAGWPLPELFDVTGHDVTIAAPAGSLALNVAFQAQGDCVTTIADVVAQ